jgi:TatD DNase family protein
VIDTHCHIAGEEFVADLPDVVGRARVAGLSMAFVILAADDTAELGRARDVVACWPEVRFAVGVHPHAAGAFADDPEGAARAVETAIAAQALARAVGEVGLDYHYDFAPRDAQQAVFRAQIRLARRLELPLVLHIREAEDDCFRILAEERAGEVGGVFHCFTGDRAMARRALDAGFSLSLSGIVTFPRALELKEVAKMVPADRLLIETDSPFLAPVPHRGGRNEPARVVHVAEVVAGLRGVAPEVVARDAAANFARLFKP